MIRSAAIALAVAALAAGPALAQDPDGSSTGRAVQAQFSAYLEASVQAMYALPDGTPEAQACRAAFWNWNDATQATEDRIETYLILDARITDPAARAELQAYFASRDHQLSLPQLISEAEVREACAGYISFPVAFEVVAARLVELMHALQAQPQ